VPTKLQGRARWLVETHSLLLEGSIPSPAPSVTRPAAVPVAPHNGASSKGVSNLLTPFIRASVSSLSLT